MNSAYFYYQDSLAVPDTLRTQVGQIDTSSILRNYTTNEVDDIFRAMELRERQLDSIARVRAHEAYLRNLEKKGSVGFDTSSVPYYFATDSIPEKSNPIRFFGREYYSPKDTSKPVFSSETDAREVVLVEKTGAETTRPYSTVDPRPDWLLGVIIISLVLLAWLKLFYNKFLDQTLLSIANYQLSTKLFRDQNIFSKRVAFALNMNFILVGSAFAYLVLGFYNLSPFHLDDFLSYLAYAGSISLALLLRYIVSQVLGHVFRKQAEFRDYLQQLLLIYKNLGVYLLVLVIGIAYISEELRIYLLYLSLVLVAAAYGLRFIKGFNIILSSKDVLIFYLILYLCTLEILPLLIFYRFFSLSFQAG